MIWLCYALSWLMVVPWAVYAMSASLWPTTEQNNYKLLDWSRWVLTTWVIVPMFWILHHCIVDGLCCNNDNTKSKKKTNSFRDYCYLVFYVLDLAFSTLECLLAVMGTKWMCNIEKGYSTWFYASLIMMLIFCYLHFLAYLFVCFTGCYLSCCAKGKSQRPNGTAVERLVANDRRAKMLSMFQPKDNKAKYEQPVVEVESKKPKKDKTPVNEYDADFNWDRNDPWLGVDVESGYVTMSLPKRKKSKQNEAFYFMYKSKNTQNPKVLVNCIGGPGCAVMTKTIGRFNPLRLNEEKRCLERNPDSITDDYHLIYMDCPVGAGFSIANKGNYVKDYETLGLNAVELFRTIFAKNPSLAGADFFFNGESFCGLSVPMVVDSLRKHLHINVKGVVLECHVMKLKEQQSGKYQLKKLNEYELWDDCCHKCCCSCLLQCGMCCYANSCIGFGTFEGVYFLPWMYSWMYSKKAINPLNGEMEETEFSKIKPTNLTCQSYDHDEIRMNSTGGNKAIEKLVCTNKFAEMIGTKKRIVAYNDNAQLDIIDNDIKYDSNDIQAGWIRDGISFMVMSGEGDYIVPWKSQYDQLKKNWEFKGKEDFLNMEWTKGAQKPGDDTYYMGKKLGNFEWRRVAGAGHLIYDDFPKYHRDYITEFMESHYSHTRPAEHSHHHVEAIRAEDIHVSQARRRIVDNSPNHHTHIPQPSPRMMHSDNSNGRAMQYSYPANANTRSMQYSHPANANTRSMQYSHRDH